VHIYADYIGIWQLHEQLQARCCVWL